MAGFRAYYPDPLPEAKTTIVLSGSEAHHLANVRRARIGEPVSLFNGDGRDGIGEITGITKKEVQIVIRTQVMHPAPSVDIVLVQACLKGKAMDTVIQKATELAVKRIIPITTDNTEVSLKGERSENRLVKWRTICIESCKQCGNAFLPEIDPVRPFGDMLEILPEHAAWVAALRPDSKQIRELAIIGKRPQTLFLLIGPEGDFSPDEYTRLEQRGARPFTLGPTVLRADTAAIAAIAGACVALNAWPDARKE